MPKITPFLWFDNQAEEAVNFYVSVFKNSKTGTVVKYSEAAAKAANMPKDTAMVVNFSLDGQEFHALNGGPYFKFNESVSFVIPCKDQKEIDYYWEKLSAVPENEQCGWLKDKYGLSWQVVPDNLADLMSSPKASAALMQMKKIIISDLKAA